MPIYARWIQTATLIHSNFEIGHDQITFKNNTARVSWDRQFAFHAIEKIEDNIERNSKEPLAFITHFLNYLLNYFWSFLNRSL